MLLQDYYKINGEESQFLITYPNVHETKLHQEVAKKEIPYFIGLPFPLPLSPALTSLVTLVRCRLIPLVLGRTIVSVCS